MLPPRPTTVTTPEKQKKLDAIFEKVQHLLDSYIVEEPPATLKFHDAKKAKVAADRAEQIPQWAEQVLLRATQHRITTKTLGTVLTLTCTARSVVGLLWAIQDHEKQIGKGEAVVHLPRGHWHDNDTGQGICRLEIKSSRWRCSWSPGT